MKRRQFNLGVGAAIAAPAVLNTAAAAAAAPSWSLTADVAESCSCEIPCPCNFGRPTELRCDGSRLIQITEGSVGGADLAGISFIATFEMRKWTRIYVDESLSEAQMQAFDKIFPIAFKGFHKLMRSMERVPLTVERTAETVRFSVPASTVEIKLLKGIDGKSITIDGLPSPAFFNYKQYESVVHTHKSEDAEFSHSGTNGFTSKMIVSA
jgi:hypothetical protein